MYACRVLYNATMYNYPRRPTYMDSNAVSRRYQHENGDENAQSDHVRPKELMNVEITAAPSVAPSLSSAMSSAAESASA